MTIKTKKIALGLQGGGSHGAFTWGVLDALFADERLEIVGLSGTSAGGMNAAAALQGYLKNGREGARQELRRFWNLVQARSSNLPLKPNLFQLMVGNYSLRGSPAYAWFNMMREIYSPYDSNPLDINPLRNIVTDFFDFELLRQSSKLKIFLCATHVKSGKLHIFKSKDLSENALLASSCLPTLFKAVEVNGEYYWDGGYVGNPAIYPLIYNCATKDIAVVQLTQSYRDLLPQTAEDIMDRHREITFNACLMREMRAIHLITTMVEKGTITDKSIKKLNMHLIRNSDVFDDLDLSTTLNTDKNFLEHLFEEGFKTGQQWLSDNFDQIGISSTADLDKDFI